MVKKILILFITMVLVGCTDTGMYNRVNTIPTSSPLATTLQPSEKPMPTNLNITTHNIMTFFNMNESQIIQKLGDSYVLSEAGPEAAAKGYYYEEYGLCFGFYEDNHLAFIESQEKFKVYGAQPGMTLKEIQAILGETTIEEDGDDCTTVKTYDICYEYDGCIYAFIAVKAIDTPTYLFIYQKDK